MDSIQVRIVSHHAITLESGGRQCRIESPYVTQRIERLLHCVKDPTISKTVAEQIEVAHINECLSSSLEDTVENSEKDAPTSRNMLSHEASWGEIDDYTDDFDLDLLFVRPSDLLVDPFKSSNKTFCLATICIDGAFIGPLIGDGMRSIELITDAMDLYDQAFEKIEDVHFSLLRDLVLLHIKAFGFPSENAVRRITCEGNATIRYFYKGT